MKIDTEKKSKIFNIAIIVVSFVLLFSVVTGIAFGLRTGTNNVQVEQSSSSTENPTSSSTQTESQTESTTEESSTEESTSEKVTEKPTQVKPTEPPRDLNKDPIIPTIVDARGKTVYLTFDDGPSIYTKEILDTLDKYGVKATFFVVNGKQNHLMKEIVDRGHQIGLHTYTHKYDVLYKSEEAYYDDLNKINEVVKSETGVETKLIRFPGGSSNAISKKYSKGLMTKLAASVTEKGYYYYDWNCTNGDAEGAKTVTDQLRYCSKFPRGANEIVVLMHDNKKLTAQSLPYIIEYYKACGMEFGILTPEVTGAHHPINN